jgi:predicted HTH transcriptional regulator
VENVPIKSWVKKASNCLKASLEPPNHELNELDWKAGLSPKKERLTEHLSGFSNHPGGGFMVFGVDGEGIAQGVHSKTVETIINQLANLGRAALEPPIALDHIVETYGSVRLLFVHIPESPVKPVHIRGKGLDFAFIRSGGTTRLASRQEIGALMLHSKTPRWEELRVSVLKSDEELLEALDARQIFEILGRPQPSTQAETIEWMATEKFIIRESCGGGYVTNLGAIAAANRLSDFGDISRKAIRIIVYDGLNKAKTIREREGSKGYAITFQAIMHNVTMLLPQSEVIEQALRKKLTVYPEVALREIIANALIHQDFTLTGTGPLIEIFSDRIEISNPGSLLPSKQLDRLIGTQPESRNEHLARAFRRYKICEERGSGLLKAGLEVELYGLPPIEFFSGSNFFKVTLYAPRTFAQMSARERLEACYQHAVLQYFSDNRLTNTSLRKRLKMPEKQRSMVSALIQEAVDKQRIKNADVENKSRKFAEYVPIWA